MKSETNNSVTFLLFALLISGLTLSACGDDGNGKVGPDTSSATSTDIETYLDAGDTTPDAGDGLPTDTSNDTDTGTDNGTESGAEFGEACSEEIKCASDGVCHEFGQLGSVCTIPCENADQCPSGSEGQKCNKSNVCRP